MLKLIVFGIICFKGCTRKVLYHHIQVQKDYKYHALFDLFLYKILAKIKIN